MILPEQNPIGGKILVSQPSLNDKFFGHSIVMLAEHGPDGSFGFIVNKPAMVKLKAITSEFGSFDNDLFLGGPLHLDKLYVVHAKGELVTGSLKIMDGVYWGGNIEEIRQLMSSGEIKNDDIRFYAGYSGWEPQQLDREMKENSWIVLNGKQRYVFGSKPNGLWKNIVLTLGENYAPWINFPFDPNMN